MWLHKGRKIALIAHPRTGSREITDECLSRRGFVRFLGHHGVPWGPDYPRPKHFEMRGDLYWWYEQDPQEWTWYAVHRNHFEVFHSIACAALGGKPPTPERFNYYLWRHPFLYRNRGILFPGFYEVPGMRELRFDYLRDDVARLLSDHDLSPLQGTEMDRDHSAHHTNAKPRGEHYSVKLDPVCRSWIEENYRLEMERFGYRWEDPSEPKKRGRTKKPAATEVTAG